MSGERQVNVKSQSELDIGGRETCYIWDCVVCNHDLSNLKSLKSICVKSEGLSIHHQKLDSGQGGHCSALVCSLGTRILSLTLESRVFEYSGLWEHTR